MCYQVDNAGLLHLVQILLQYRKPDADETMKELSTATQTLTV
jgi:hypothetical protein